MNRNALNRAFLLIKGENDMNKARKWTNPDELQKAVDRYFAECEASRREYPLKNGGIQIRYENVPSMIGLAVFLDVNKDTLYSWINEEDRGLGEDIQKRISGVLLRARARVEQSTLARALDGTYDSRIAAMVLGKLGYSAASDNPSTIVIVEGGKTADVSEWSK